MDGNVSTRWTFTDTDTGYVFTIYDYKATSLYDSGLPSIKKFRELKSYEWGVGGRNNQATGLFFAWLVETLARKTKMDPRIKAHKAVQAKKTTRLADAMERVGKALD